MKTILVSMFIALSTATAFAEPTIQCDVRKFDAVSMKLVTCGSVTLSMNSPIQYGVGTCDDAGIKIESNNAPTEKATVYLITLGLARRDKNGRGVSIENDAWVGFPEIPAAKFQIGGPRMRDDQYSAGCTTVAQ
jgi:acetyltransferase-like isoleucine patch superfamily enzyme